MTLTQILQKIRAAFYTKSQIDSIGGGASLDTTIRSKQNALSTAQLSAVNSGITSNKVSQYDEYINGASGQPVGSILWVMGSSVPAGYLICNGSAVSRTAYDKLFQAIGTKYGEGDGSTTFNLPNLIGKFLQGDTTSGTTGGEASHTLTIDEIPSHRHTSVRRCPGTDDQNFSGHIANAVASNDASADREQLYTDYTGGSMAHNNLPPYITSIPCIKAFDSVIDATTVSVAQLSDTKVNKAGDTMTGSLTAPSFITNGIDCSVDSQGVNWIRYNNGLQICWVYVKLTNTVYTWSFPKTFSQNPVITTAVNYLGTDGFNLCQRCVELNNLSNTGVLLRSANHLFGDTAMTTGTDVIDAIAIGRWK